MTECLDHTHRRYYLSCEQFAQLKQYSDGLCNICGMRERYMPNGFYIDHDHELGLWAVRGLLCPRCNTVIEIPGKLLGPELDAYLSTPWHVRVGLCAPPLIVPRPLLGTPVAAAPNLEQEQCKQDLDRLGRRFLDLRGPGKGLNLATRQFAKAELHPVICEAQGLGISVRDVARRTGYTPEHIYEIWRAGRYRAGAA